MTTIEALRQAVSALKAIRANLQAPADDGQRAAVAELSRVIAVGDEALAGPSAASREPTAVKMPNPCAVCGTFLWNDRRPCWNCLRTSAASRELKVPDAGYVTDEGDETEDDFGAPR